MAYMHAENRLAADGLGLVVWVSVVSIPTARHMRKKNIGAGISTEIFLQKKIVMMRKPFGQTVLNKR